jgi:transcriptional regulator with XRE-family HTH domain
VLHTLSKKVICYRKNIGFTQQQLANKAKVHVNFIGKIERSQCNPTFKILVSIARALEISPKELMPE